MKAATLFISTSAASMFYNGNMPRWPEGFGQIAKTCPKCGGPKYRGAKGCRKCMPRPVGLLGRKGKDHPTWKGGSQIDRDGYIRLYLPDHPWPRRGGYVLAHVAVMELSIGRRIAPGEVVHHINHDPKDNRLENLQILSAGEHSKHHRRLDSHLRRRDKGGRFV